MLEAAQAQLHLESLAAFSRLDVTSALVVAAALMPSIRELAIKNIEHNAGRKFTFTDNALIQAAMHLLDDAGNAEGGAPQQQG